MNRELKWQCIDLTANYKYYSYGYGMETRRERPTGNPVYLHKDVLGSITAITDGDGNIVGTYEYDPYGDMMTSADGLEIFGFTSQEWDNDISLYHFPARYYESQWGRFLTRDPLGDYWINTVNFSHMNTIQRNTASGCNLATTDEWHDPQSWNGYTYTRNNSVNLVDPTGLRDCLLSIISLGGGYGLPISENVEGGKMFMTDIDCGGKIYEYNYLCAGIGVGPLKLGGGLAIEPLGVVDCPDKPKDLGGWGWQISGYSAAKTGGAFSLIGKGFKVIGESFGAMLGINAGISGMACYTWYKGPARWKGFGFP